MSEFLTHYSSLITSGTNIAILLNIETEFFPKTQFLILSLKGDKNEI